MTNNLKKNEPWRHSEFIVLDLEGTGFQHKEKEGIVEVAALHISNGKILDKFYYQMINPEIEIPPMVSRIHGLKNKDLLDKPTFSQIENDLFNLLQGKILAGHHVIVDYKLLKLKMPNYEPSLVIDTKKISKHFWRDERKHGLDNLIERFGIQDALVNLPIKRERHSAYYDAFATAKIFIKMMKEKFSPNSTLQELIRIAKIDQIQDNDNIQGTLF
jgi:DNA polymerase III epsilon subunit family exonuclease